MTTDLQSAVVKTAENLNSRSGFLSLPSAIITTAELDTIEAELKERPIRGDRISILISVISAIIVSVKILNTENWYQSKLELVIFIGSIALAGVQLYKMWLSTQTKTTEHKKNADRYLANLRKATGE